jgi:predicted neuraminidase
MSGKVVNFAGEPIPGAAVQLQKAGISATAANDGSFTLSGESPGQSGSVFDDSLVVTQTGYLDYQTRMYNQPKASGMIIRMASVDHPVWSREMLYEEGTADFPSCHAASIVELPDGTLLSVYFGGSKESADDVEVRLSRKEPGQAWEAPIALTDAPDDGLSVENPSIFQDREGKIFVFWKSTHGSPNRIGTFKVSTDGGKTWSEARRMCDKCHGPEKNKAVQLEDGTILCPTSDRNGFFNGGYLFVERSTDGGETWEPVVPPADDGGLPQAKQPTIMFHADGRLQMMSRSKGGKIPMVWSSDNGNTWSPMERSVLPANNSGVDAVTLRDGRQFLTYNHVPTKEGSKGGRCFLNAAVSNDGVAWNAALVLGICDGGQFSYPAVIQSRDGLVHIVHTWHRKTIAHIVVNPYKITDDNTVPMPDGEWPTSGPLSKEENQDKEG